MLNLFTKQKMSKKLVQGEDFYINKQGLYVFTAKYLKERGYCCKNGCKHCPYGFVKESTEKKKSV